MDYTPHIASLSSTTHAVLASLVASQHVLVYAPASAQPAALQDLQHAAASTFGLTCATVHCTPATTLSDFAQAAVVDDDDDDHDSSLADPRLDTRRVASLVLACDLDLAPRDVQLLALDLLHTRRITTKTTLHTCPPAFCLVAVVRSAWPRFKTRHLCDRFWISHAHDAAPSPLPSPLPSPPLSPQLQPVAAADTDPQVTRREPGALAPFSASAIAELRRRADAVNATAEIRRYMHDIPTFLRLHRAVGGGVSAHSPRYLGELARILAVLHGLTYVTPSLVGLAARKVYTHRVILVRPEQERSLQWGSDVDAVRALLDGMTPDGVVDQVVRGVACPL